MNRVKDNANHEFTQGQFTKQVGCGGIEAVASSGGQNNSFLLHSQGDK